MNSAMADPRAWALDTSRAIWLRLARAHFIGWDPYDALGSGWLAPLVKGSTFAQRALTQMVRRSPFPLERALGVQAAADPYTLGHALVTAARMAALDTLPDSTVVVEQLAERITSMCIRDGDAVGWGYSFPVNTRFFSYQPATPNIVSTAFVAKGLAAAMRAGLLDASGLLKGACVFVQEGLPRIEGPSGVCFGYLPGESAVIHNANMLAALVLCEAAELAGSGGALDDAFSAARFTASRQAADGSWPYSQVRGGRWVDGFHTGFVLEGLARVARATSDPLLADSLNRGVRFYVAQLFGAGGEPKYYPWRSFPLNSLSAAQGLETLHVAIGGQARVAVPHQLEWIARNLVDANGRVAYQVHRGWTDWREFPRWSSAPMMSALVGAAAALEVSE